MKALLFVLAIGLVHVPSGVVAQSYSTQQLQELFIGHLTAEGLQPEINSRGNVRFRRNGRGYVVQVDSRDPTYLRMTMAFVADDRSAEMRLRMLEACNSASSEVKAVKCFLDEDGDPTFAAEMFVVIPGDFKVLFARSLRAMDSAFERYNRRLGETR